MRHLRARRVARDHGAAAVEFALVVPLLLLLVFGLVDFGRAYNAKITLAQAAREGARLVALGQANVVSRTQSAASPLTPVTVTAPGSCPAGSDAVVTVAYQFTFLTPVGTIATLFGASGIGAPVAMTGRGVMPCQG
jgi:Flp pilus assembly protein TadG